MIHSLPAAVGNGLRRGRRWSSQAQLDFPLWQQVPTFHSSLESKNSARLTIDKLEVSKRLCPRIKKLDISMFNFSFDDQDEATAAELSKSSAMYFEFEVKV